MRIGLCFGEACLTPERRQVAEARIKVMAEKIIAEEMAEQQRPSKIVVKDGLLVVNAGLAARINALQAEAAKQGKKLSFREARTMVCELEMQTGLNPHEPVIFSEAQRQVRSILTEEK